MQHMQRTSSSSLVCFCPIFDSAAFSTVQVASHKQARVRGSEKDEKGYRVRVQREIERKFETFFKIRSEQT
jgi:hypothetical protein